jgi:RNA polymerase sigma-70 factor (ECF subfamily)
MAGYASLSHDLEATFLAAYQQHGPCILRYLWAQSRNRVEAEDLHSETFCKAWEAWGRFHGDELETRAWLYRIARNLVIDRHRRRRFVFLPIDGHHGWMGNDEVATCATGKVLLRYLVGQISGRDQELVALRVAGLTHAEIGKRQGRSEVAVKIAWHRTVQRMRGHLDGVAYG